MGAPKGLLSIPVGLLLGLFFCQISCSADPWQELQERFAAPTPSSKPVARGDDPWQRLQAIYLPFTEAEEEAALDNAVLARRVADGLNQALAPHRLLIREGAVIFDIPEEVIGAVIMVESGGQAHARAKTSSAKGLMQTIDATFRLARKKLLERGIVIKDDPFEPRSSIVAGCWYLDRMFRQANEDASGIGPRKEIRSWRLPAEYYYAGPGNGRKKADVVILYAGGRRLRIDKPAYSRKVMRWANIIAKGRG